mmetsp:Transcript_122766/g.281513  ORF Transcript_122766/g.281513 Transcript_122766/m.281513 type:complete len:95 (+) Transcript_122766:272-556(+)
MVSLYCNTALLYRAATYPPKLQGYLTMLLAVAATLVSAELIRIRARMSRSPSLEERRRAVSALAPMFDLGKPELLACEGRYPAGVELCSSGLLR